MWNRAGSGPEAGLGPGEDAGSGAGSRLDQNQGCGWIRTRAGTESEIVIQMEIGLDID